MNWRTDLKAGDRIRLTLEGVVRECAPDLLVLVPSSPSAWINRFNEDILDAPTTKIEKLQRPIKVGDKVRMYISPDYAYGTVLGRYGDSVWLVLDNLPDQPHTRDISVVELVE